MSLFERMAARSRRVVHHVHGELVVVHPIDRQYGPNGGRIRSLTRSAFDGTGCFYDVIGVPGADTGQPPIDRQARLLHRSPSLTVSIALNPSAPIRTGDIIERKEKGTWHEITEIEPDGVGGATLTLAIAKGLPDA